MVGLRLASSPCIFFLQVLSVLLMVVVQAAAHNAAPDPPLQSFAPVHHPPSAHKRVERQGTNSPLFIDQPSCTASVVENSAVGMEVARVQAQESNERELTYSLQQAGITRYFRVDSSNGVITTKGNLPTPQQRPFKSSVAALVLHELLGVMHVTNGLWGCKGATFVRSALLSKDCGWLVGLLKVISTLELCGG